MLCITHTIVFFVCMISCNGVSYNDSSVSPFRQVIVLDNVIYIGAVGGIVALHRENLSVIQTEKIYSNNWLLLYDSNKDQVIQCNDNFTKTSWCRKLNSSLEIGGMVSSNMTVNITNLPSYTLVHVPQAKVDVAIIAATSLQLLNNTYGIVSLNLETLRLFLHKQNQRGPMNIELGIGKNYDLVFKSTFSRSNYVYFFFQVWFKNGNFSTSKIGKLCINNTNAKNMSSGFYHSYEDMTIKCKNFTHLQFQYFTEDFVLAVFSKDNSSAVCRFNWNSIETKFRESRKESLKCGQNTTNKDSYFIPKANLGNGGHENCFNKNGTCMKDNEICDELNGDFCNTEIHHTVIGGTGIENEKPEYVVDKVITALDLVRLNNNVILFVGTDDGEIATVSIDITSSSKPEKKYIKYYRVDTTKVVHIKAEQSYVYVMTEETVTKMYLENCTLHQNCESCMMSLNPYCGWDYKNRKCYSDGTDWWWNPFNVSFCIKISDLPKEVEMRSDSVFRFNVTGLKRTDIPQDKILTCVICGKMSNVTDNAFECKSNIIRFSPGTYTFALKLDGVILAEESIVLYKCQQFNTCKECTSRSPCGWSSNTFQCGDALTTDLSNEDECPRLNNTGYPILIKEKEHPINFTINLLKFEDIKNNTKSMFMCEATIQNDTVLSLEVQFDTMDSAACIGLQLNATEEHGPTQYRIRLKFKTFYVDNEAILYVYNCSKLLTDRRNCFECQKFIKSEYDCKWCHSEDKCYDSGDQTCSDTTSSANCTIEITKVFPTSGPINGGTWITITGHNIGNKNDSIKGVDCTDFGFLHTNRQISCKTGKKDNSSRYAYDISISVNGMGSTYDNPFIYKRPTMTSFRPTKGIAAGNTTITITGKNITFQGTNRYYVAFCNGTMCIKCSLFNNTKEGEIKCKTGNVTAPQEMNILLVRIDELTNLTLSQSFRYFPDPTGINLSNGTTDVINSGGSKITINGEGFSNVGSVTVDNVDEPCDVPSDTTVICKTPEIDPSKDRNQIIRVHFDGLTAEISVNYVDDPAFDVFPGILEYDKESTIQIMGRNILRGAREDDYSIQIGLDGRCYVIDITMTTITCYPPKTVPRTNHSDVNIVFVVVKVGRIRKYVGNLNYKVVVEILPIVVGVLSAALVIAIVIGLLAVLILKKKKKKAIKEFQLELVSREDMIRKTSREEFADAQMSIRDIKTDLITSRVPYCSYQTYIFRQLFPNQEMDTHSLLQESTIRDDRKSTIQSAMDKLDKLLTNKLFLKSLVQTLDRQNKLTMQEKAHFASVLSIALLGNMRLFYDLLTCLLTDMIESASKKQQKVLFRRFESITQRLTANWLQLTLYEQLKSQIGIQLFMLYKAVQTITEKAPIDALTGNSKNTLAEEKLLKMRIEYETLTLHIYLNNHRDQSYPVKVLDCDTISQVKRKCCLQIYKNKPVTEIPDNNELILEWQHGKCGKVVLDDINTISERGNGLVRLNTLRHYMVKDNSRMILMYKEDEDTNEIYENSDNYKRESATTDDINLLISEGQTSDEIKWHLECSTSNLPNDVKSNREQDIGDLFLNRLFHTKLLLMDYIDTAFEDLIDHKSLSVPMRYFLCMLDKLGKDFDVESDVLQIWKSECYGTRVWGPLIGSPQIIFEIDVPCHVEPCLDILRQVFVESLTQTPHKVSKESPPQKLLFHKDIPRYRNLIAPFLELVESVSDQEFWSAMDELSQYQKQDLGFSRQATLCMLYNMFIEKYKCEIIDGFEEMEASNDLEFANKLEEIIELMEEP